MVDKKQFILVLQFVRTKRIPIKEPTKLIIYNRKNIHKLHCQFTT